MRKIKVIQWGAGKNGCALIRGVVGHASLQLVGCRVYSPAKNGVDAGELANIDPIGVLATTDRQAIMDMEADVVLHLPRLTPQDFPQMDQDIMDLLRSGKNVINATGAYSYPAAFPGKAEKIEAACLAGGSTFAHSGVNPGFICERLATTITGLCTDVSGITVEETYDCSKAAKVMAFDTIGFGKAPEEWSSDSPLGRMFHHLFLQVINNMANILGVKIKDIKHTVEVVPAHRDIEIAGGIIKKGQVAAVVQRWEGIPEQKGQIIIGKQTCWTASDDIPGYPVKSGWQIHVDGIPSFDLELRMSPEGDKKYEAECMVGAAISVIPEVIKAPPGILLPKIFAPFKKEFL